MLTPEENALLTQVGPGTPCGALLRRYWQPVCYVGDLSAEAPTRAVTIMGEELVVFRLPDGSYGCMQAHCAHRGTSLRYGFVEDCGIRCAYHGWKYDATGQCIEQPFEPAGSTFKERIKLRAYPARALGGLVFVYMGPEPAPVLPPWDFLVWTHGRRMLERQPPLNCSWLQAEENTADVTHTYFLHGHMLYTRGKKDRATLRLYRPFEGYGFQPFEWGLLKTWKYGETELWPAVFEAGNMLLFPNILRFAYSMHWRVPLDDTHTHVFAMRFITGEPASPEELENPPIEDHPAQYLPDGSYDMSTIWAHDRMAWETQGPVMDRSNEHLGASDRGVVLYRQMLRQQIERVQEGLDPLGLLRDPREIIELPLDQYVDANAAPSAGAERTVFDYLNDEQEWFDVPRGAARAPGYMREEPGR
jgi:5,5'-dehydrodivanillate O-demethylase